MTSSPSSIELTPFSETAFVKSLQSLFPAKEIEKALGDSKYFKYQDDPAGFGIKVLGEAYTPDIVTMMESVRDNTITIAKSGNATGKSLPINTPVLTPSGFVKIGSLKTGDFVIGANGKPTKIIGVFPQGLQPTYKITFNDDSEILCSSDHLWNVRSSSDQGRGKPYKTLTTEEILVVKHRHMHIPMCSPVHFTEKKLKLDPYVMGVLIGDGTLGQYVRFDTADDWIQKRVQKRVPANVRYYRKTHYGITTPAGQPNAVLMAVKEYNLLGTTALTKHIPGDYLFGSIPQRKALLRGLMDTDGYIDLKHSMSFTTISPQLSRQVQQLVWSLGGTAKIREKNPVFTYNGVKKQGRKAYNLYIKLPFCPFTVPRKVDRYLPEKDLQKQAQRVFKKFELVGSRKSVCIKVAASDGLFLMENFIVTHNTHGAARVCTWWYKCFPNSQVYSAAAPPEANLKKLLWGEIGTITERHPILFANDDVTSLLIKRAAQSFMTGVTVPTSGTEATREAKFSGKHAPNLLFVLDEGDAIPDEVYKGIESCMSGGNVRLLIMFNPRARQGEPYRMERDNRAHIVPLSAFNHPNVMTGKDIIPGAVTAEVTIRRINKWCRPLTKEEIPDENDKSFFQLPGFLEDVTAKREDGTAYPPLTKGWYKVMEPAFSTMVLGEYPSQTSNSLISREWINKARARWDAYVKDFGETPPANTFPTLGGDVAGEGGDLNIACLRYGGWVPKLKEWSGVDPFVSGEKFIEVYKRNRCLSAFIDATGLGAGVAPHMLRHGCMAAGVTVSNKPTRITELGAFKIMRDQLAWLLREWLKNDPFAMLPPDEYLEEELLIFQYSTDSGKVEVTKTDVIREKLKRSPDRFWALAMTFAEGIGAEPEKRPLNVEMGPKQDRKRILTV